MIEVGRIGILNGFLLGFNFLIEFKNSELELCKVMH